MPVLVKLKNTREAKGLSQTSGISNAETEGVVLEETKIENNSSKRTKHQARMIVIDANKGVA